MAKLVTFGQTALLPMATVTVTDWPVTTGILSAGGTKPGRRNPGPVTLTPRACALSGCRPNRSRHKWLAVHKGGRLSCHRSDLVFLPNTKMAHKYVLSWRLDREFEEFNGSDFNAPSVRHHALRSICSLQSSVMLYGGRACICLCSRRRISSYTAINALFSKDRELITIDGLLDRKACPKVVELTVFTNLLPSLGADRPIVLKACTEGGLLQSEP